jgi:hypothetical protein
VKGGFFVEIWVKSDRMEGKKREEGRHTRTFTHGAKNSCTGSNKERAHLIAEHIEKLIASQGKIYV